METPPRANSLTTPLLADEAGEAGEQCSQAQPVCSPSPYRETVLRVTTPGERPRRGRDAWVAAFWHYEPGVLALPLEEAAALDKLHEEALRVRPGGPLRAAMANMSNTSAAWNHGTCRAHC